VNRDLTLFPNSKTGAAPWEMQQTDDDLYPCYLKMPKLVSWSIMGIIAIKKLRY